MLYLSTTTKYFDHVIYIYYSNGNWPSGMYISIILLNINYYMMGSLIGIVNKSYLPQIHSLYI